MLNGLIDSVSGRELYWWTTFNINTLFAGKVGQNPQSQATQAGVYVVLKIRT